MEGNILKRLEELEKKICQDPIRVLAEVDGEEVTLTVKEALERDAGFIKVVSGANLADLDLLLKDLKDKAEEDIRS